MLDDNNLDFVNFEVWILCSLISWFPRWSFSTIYGLYCFGWGGFYKTCTVLHIESGSSLICITHTHTNDIDGEFYLPYL